MPRTPRTPRPTELGARAAYDQAWQRRMYDSGWAGIAWPRAHGGRGATLMEQLVWCEEYARAGAPDISTLFVGLNHAGPTLVACGTEEQKAAHLPPILRGEVIWCQGFSEPNAGSDLASLQTRAVVEGDVLVVSGQKVWTSFAHGAQFQELLVRTDPEAPRHRRRRDRAPARPRARRGGRAPRHDLPERQPGGAHGRPRRGGVDDPPLLLGAGAAHRPARHGHPGRARRRRASLALDGALPGRARADDRRRDEGHPAQHHRRARARAAAVRRWT